MASINTLRLMVKNGWTIANRKAIISEIGKNTFDDIVNLAKKTGRTGDRLKYSKARTYLSLDRINATKEALTQTNTGYHGSPFLFEAFDASKIGSGEGMNRFCRGLYLSRGKQIAPFYANIRCPDAPQRLGTANHKLANANPTVYTVEGLNNLNLKLCGEIEATKIKSSQAVFQAQNPHIDGIELMNGEITVFQESIHKLSIVQRDNVVDFVKMNKNYPFKPWTTDTAKLNSIHQT